MDVEHTQSTGGKTFQFQHEDHTLGNALRWMLAKDPRVEFVGYSIPHPSEPLMNLRLQSYNEGDEDTVILEALEQLERVSSRIEEKFAKALKRYTKHQAE